MNRLVPGGNYGWPVVTGIATDPRYVDPLLELERMAPTGLAFYTGTRLSHLRGSLLLGNFVFGQLVRIDLDEPGERVLRQEVILDLDAQILDVEMGADGELYLTTPTSILRVDQDPSELRRQHLLLAPLVALAGVVPVLIVLLSFRLRERK